jgi:DNA-binding transcriptional ArsR family regulator
MVASPAESRVSSIAAAIGEPARARMLYSLIDGRTRTSTELAAVGDVSPSTASVHLQRLRNLRLVDLLVQGKHRYYRLAGPDVADALEALSVLAGGSREPLVTTAPRDLRAARTCYDHIAGALGVALHDRLVSTGCLAVTSGKDDYDVTTRGIRMMTALGIDLDATRSMRRRFAFGCLDWSERRPHLGGALAAAVLGVALKKRWVTKELDSRVLNVTRDGRREFKTRFGVEPVSLQAS